MFFIVSQKLQNFWKISFNFFTPLKTFLKFSKFSKNFVKIFHFLLNFFENCFKIFSKFLETLSIMRCRMGLGKINEIVKKHFCFPASIIFFTKFYVPRQIPFWSQGTLHKRNYNSKILTLYIIYRVCLKSIEKNFFSEFLLPINVQTVSIPQNMPLGRQYTFGSIFSTPGRHPGRQMTEGP